MNYRFHKNFKISEIGIGTYSLSGVYGNKDLNEFKKMINKAYEIGINFLIQQRHMVMQKFFLVNV